MITFCTLSKTSVREIATCFNAAFSDYLIPFSLTPRQLEDKMIAEDVALDLSVGVFSEDNLVGFILHGIREINGRKIAYNAGTGVAPTKRGAGLTNKMYEHILPVLMEKNILRLEHEVLCENYPAIAVYKKAGFVETGKLNCYKGELKNLSEKTDITVLELKAADWKLFQTFWDFEPAWQNACKTIDNISQDCKVIAGVKNDITAGYLIYNYSNKRILQIAVDKKYRRQGIGNGMLKYLQQNYTTDVSIINVDDNSYCINSFLKNAGLEMYVSQFKMEKSLQGTKVNEPLPRKGVV